MPVAMILQDVNHIDIFRNTVKGMGFIFELLESFAVFISILYISIPLIYFHFIHIFRFERPQTRSIIGSISSFFPHNLDTSIRKLFFFFKLKSWSDSNQNCIHLVPSYVVLWYVLFHSRAYH